MTIVDFFFIVISLLIFFLCITFRLGINRIDCSRRLGKIYTRMLFWLKRIPTKTFAAGDEELYETCCICQEDYVIGDKLRLLGCDHAYHAHCIDPWLRTTGVCPQCRKEVLVWAVFTEDERTPLLGRRGEIM